MTVLLDKTNIRESSTRAFREGAPSTGVRREIIIIEAGWGSSGYYSEQVLERDIPRIFTVGTHMYLNHPTFKEDQERPERDLRDLVAVVEESPRMAGIASVAVCNIFEHWLEVFNNEKFLESIGVSIRAFGITEDGAAAGKEGPIVQQLTEGLSIDFVTMAGAGGSIGPMVESARKVVVPLIESARTDPKQHEIEETLHSDLRERLCNAGTEAWGDDNTYVYCEDFDEKAGYAIFWINPDDEAGYYYKVNFTQTDDGVTLDSEPETVDRQTQYVPAEENRVPPRILDEARNAGNWLEAYIHRTFTERADNLFGEGHLTREERITLSSAIGSGLEAFSAQLEEEAPQLFQRDPYEELGPSEEQYISEKCGSGRLNEGDSMTEEERKRLSESEDRVRQLERENAELKEETGKLQTRAERAEETNLLNEAQVLAVEAIGEPEGLSAKGIARAVREATRGELPTDSQGRLDRSALEERARGKAREELEYIGATTGNGQVRGLGESRRESQLPGGGGSGNGGGEATEEDLTEALQEIGMPEGVAKLAAKGR
jgi:hypothetical protein